MSYRRNIEGRQDAAALALIFRRIGAELRRDSAGVASVHLTAAGDIKRSPGLNGASETDAQLGGAGRLPTKLGAVFISTQPWPVAISA